MRLAFFTFGFVLCAIAIDSGLPRLIGHGCNDKPSVAGIEYSGPRLARFEDDFGQCERIEPIF